MSDSDLLFMSIPFVFMLLLVVMELGSRVKITDSSGKVYTVPTYKPGGLLKETKVSRVVPKSAWLLSLEATQSGQIPASVSRIKEAGRAKK